MKTIDTKSLLLGAALSVLFITLTSSKISSDNNPLQFFTRGGVTNVFNSQTNTVYEYHGTNKGKISDQPANVYKIAPDGSSITSN